MTVVLEMKNGQQNISIKKWYDSERTSITDNNNFAKQKLILFSMK